MKKIFLNGIYPRSDKLVRATMDFERKRVSEEEVIEKYKEDYKTIFEMQKDMEYISDGLLNWQDLLRPFSEIIEGVNAGGLKRYFETNSFYRVLYFERKFKIKENKIDEWIEKYFKLPDKDLKRLLILPSPLLFKEFSEGIDLKSLCDLIKDICEIIVPKRKGIVFFEDPVIVKKDIKDEEKNILRKFYEELYKKGYEVITQTYFGKISGALDFLLALPLKGIGIDLLRNSIEDIKKWDNGKTLVAGIVDCENSWIERKEEIEELVKNLKNITKNIYLCGNCDFLFLPQKVANQKFNLLKNVES